MEAPLITARRGLDDEARTSDAGVDVADRQARRFALVYRGQVCPATLDGVAEAIEYAHYSADEPWEQLYAVHGSELVPTFLHPIDRPNVDSADYIHPAYMITDDSRVRVPRRYFGTVYTRIDGRV